MMVVRAIQAGTMGFVSKITLSQSGDGMYRIISILLIMFLSGIAAGCAMPVPRTEAATTAGVPETQAYWWYARYRIVWPEGAEPDWRVDLLLADAVIKPVLDEHRQQFRYWRFHRRALRDNAGHQFSLIFYADRNTAARVYSALASDTLAGKLVEKNILQKVVTDNIETNHLGDVADTSDKNWSETLQNAWPAYIMGVSDMWLQLIELNVDEYPPDADVDDLLRRYGIANDRITAMWQNEGRHAFLHHLNAIFGYAPITINEAMRF